MKPLLPAFGIGLVLIASAAAADLNLGGFDLAKITTTDAQAATNGVALRIVTGHKQAWPGVQLAAPKGHWDLSAYSEIRLRVKNTGTNEATIRCRVDNPGADGTRHCVTASLTLPPGQSDTLKVPLRRTSESTLGGKLFGMRGYPAAPGISNVIDPKNITALLFFVSKPATSHTFEIADLTAAGNYTKPTAWVTDANPFFPFIDTFGQYQHKDWPGKTQSPADLAAKREQEARELLTHPGPDGWDQYGGAANGSQLKATGFFRTEKVRGKWWLVDPDGHLFFSQGITGVRMSDSTAVAERADWFADFPGDQPAFKPFFSKAFCLKGHYAGRNVECFSFRGANLLRKYGPDWKKVYPELVHQRLRSWGLNTIANWSDDSICRLRRTPYTDTISSRSVKPIEGSDGYWGKFPDVFDPGFAASLRSVVAEKKGKTAGDPWCLGYFSDNEMSWGNDTSLALAALKSPSDQAAKQAFITDLQAKYGDIAKLNAAWGTAHASWDALLQTREAPDQKKAQADLVAFYSHTAEQYFRTVRDIIKAVAPQQLYLGCRFAWVNDRAALAAAKFCDVVSYNRYQRSLDGFQFPGGRDVPLIIGEFHFGALDRGLFHTGLVPVASQADRAKAYTDYVRSALRHPQFVGTHWFQFQDEPTTGRNYDEENYQIGFVDIVDTPYAETIAACRNLGATLYR